MEKHRGPCARRRVPCDSALLKEGKGLVSLEGSLGQNVSGCPMCCTPVFAKGRTVVSGGNPNLKGVLSGSSSHAVIYFNLYYINEVWSML